MRVLDDDDDNYCEEYFRYTGRARLSRDMHILEGYMHGLTADARVSDIELKALIRWVTEHQEFANFHPFNEILPRIREIIANGIIDERIRADVLWIANKFTTSDEYYDGVTSDMQRLQGVLAGILADNRITKAELESLHSWVAERTHLCSVWPYDQLAGVIDHVLRDGKIDPQEHEALLQFLGEFVSTGQRRAVGVIERDVTISNVCAFTPIIQFPTRCFCFTGASERCSRKEIATFVTRMGGRFQEDLREDTDYLVVGAKGNRCWAYACYGRKVEEAVDRRRNGQSITIVNEYDFWQAVDGSPSSVDDGQIAQPSVSTPKTRNDQHRSTTRRRSRRQVAREPPLSYSIAGKTFVVTGTLEKYTRDEIHDLITRHGGRATSSVSKTTDYLVAGEKAGSKLDKATKLGVTILSETDFEKLIPS